MKLVKRLSRKALSFLQISAVLLFIGILSFIAWAVIRLTEKFVDAHTEVNADEWF